MLNPLDPIVETLRSAAPRPEAVERTVAAVRRPRPPRLLPLAVGVAVLSGAMLWPRPGDGLAWAQVASQTMPPRYVLRTYRLVSGTPVLDSLVAQDLTLHHVRAWFGLPNGTSYDFRYGPRVSYTEREGYSTVARVSTKGDIAKGWIPHDATMVDLRSMLENDRLHQLGIDRAKDTRLGKADVYHLDQPLNEYDRATKRMKPGRARIDVYVQPEGTRVLGWDNSTADGKVWSRSNVEYPTRIPASEFEPPSKPRLPVYRMDRAVEQVERNLVKGLATVEKNGATSTLVVVAEDHAKAIWTVWRGAPPNGDLAHPVKFIGLKNGAAFGLAALTSKGDRGYHPPYGGHAVQLRRKVEKVDLDLPIYRAGMTRSVFVGYRRAQNVPVVTIDSIYSLYDVLRLSRQRKITQ